MLILFESAVGYAVFKLKDDKKLEKVDKLHALFEDPASANKLLNLQAFEKFSDVTEAVECATSMLEGKASKKLKKLLKKIVAKEPNEIVGVADPKLATYIKEKFNVSSAATSAVQQLMSCIRLNVENLIPEWSPSENEAMEMGLSHGISRYQLKFSADKVDTMIIQAVSLLDNLDKELNNYIMRCKEWYGWHFPELAKVVPDNTSYIKAVLKMGIRTNAYSCDFSEFLAPETEQEIKELAEVSMGTDISEEDMMNIEHLCRNVLDMQEYRTQLFEYLKNRMMAIAPNLTMLVGELVGARLITHAGSLINLAKHPASTIQILGAEKALFRALKTRHDTPKYGLIYHAQLVGQSNPRLKGKMSRMLAAKSALACRVDAMGENPGNALGLEHKAKLEARLKVLEESKVRAISGTGKAQAKWDKYENKSQMLSYKSGGDSTMPQSGKRKHEKDDDQPKASASGNFFGQKVQPKTEKDDDDDEDSDDDDDESDSSEEEAKQPPMFSASKSSAKKGKPEPARISKPAPQAAADSSSSEESDDSSDDSD